MSGNDLIQLSLTLALAASVALSPYLSLAEDIYVPESPLSNGTTKRLDFQPTVVAASDGLLVVAGGRDEMDAHIAILDPSTLEVMRQIQPKMLVEDVAVTADGDKIIVAGSNGVSTELVVYTDGLNELSHLDLDRLVGYPKLSIEDDSVLALAGQRTSIALPALSFYRLNDNGELAWRKDFQTEMKLGSRGAWIDTTAKLVFVNNATRPSVAAYDFNSGRRVATLQVQSDISRDLTAYSVFGLVGSECGGSAPASLLISDGSSRVSLVDFDPLFESFDVKAAINVRLRLLPGTKLETLKDTSSVKPPALLASVCDQSVIWVANSFSNEIAQFSRNPLTSDLEKVGSLDLPGLPNAVALQPNGQHGYAVLKIAKSVVSFRRSAPDSEANPIVGDDKVREIQRFLSAKGYLYGSIDGLVGPSTVKALEVIGKRYAVDLDIRSDPAATLSKLKSTLAGE
ncbi:peptidoglycan-binding domain-containing protein [Rhizobium ruizarguesonis]|uniref:peptidoglycan-binding domain-containing protein n=1 Tax=Rhizobium ruizarguesonis TaxID=2081791 RepID=UPI0010314642|nr:peptidoglycan-binding domain-containing protein [Rhizobium ruizarguesonis]TAZ23401.1 peptidoglycan-binding protein [Rhizobium ruizarguesonis]TBD07707.1 peptidoglycan-binding protein [Rhizobium ruizarguesonis]